MSLKMCTTLGESINTSMVPVLEAFPLPALLVDNNGIVRIANPLAYTWVSDDPVQKDVFSLFEENTHVIQEYLQSQRPGNIQVKLKSPKGIFTPCTVIFIPFIHRSSKPYFLLFIEAAPFFQLETTQTIHNALIFQQLVEMAPIMIGIYLDDIIQYVNPTGVQLMGAKSRKELIGKKVDDFIHPDSRKLVAQRRKELNFKRVLPPIEEQLIRLDGKVIDVEVVTARLPIKGKNAILAVGRDITRQKAVERALKESEARYFHLMEISPNAILIISKYKIQYINPAGLQLLGGDTVDALSQFPITKFLPKLKNLIEWENETSSQSRSIETTLVQLNGNRLDVDIILTPVIVNGQVAAQLIIRNITDRKQYEKNLKESRDRLRQLSSYLQSIREEERAHIAREIHDELGQMLTGLKLNLAMVERRLSLSSPEIVARIKEMSAMVDDTIKVVRRIASELRPEILDDLGLLAAIEWQAQEYWKRSGVRVFLKFEPEEFTVDKQRATTIFRIFQETLTNIMRHAQATEVFITLSQKQEGIELIVEDNGIGINLQAVEKQQSLGLMGIRERAHFWNGTVQITGVPGEGTRVKVWIPGEGHE